MLDLRRYYVIMGYRSGPSAGGIGMSLGEGMYCPTHSYRPDAHSQPNPVHDTSRY